MVEPLMMFHQHTAKQVTDSVRPFSDSTAGDPMAQLLRDIAAAVMEARSRSGIRGRDAATSFGVLPDGTPVTCFRANTYFDRIAPDMFVPHGPRYYEATPPEPSAPSVSLFGSCTCLTEPILPIGTQAREHFTQRGRAAHTSRAPPPRAPSSSCVPMTCAPPCIMVGCLDESAVRYQLVRNRL